ncbi:MAG: SgcJ/EcaC family oxidoreductase [Leptolyngbya sp.]|nr:SgcJ/EcaC family oxidoreductase [Candidatus Melainabacteria bacterium]
MSTSKLKKLALAALTISLIPMILPNAASAKSTKKVKVQESTKAKTTVASATSESAIRSQLSSLANAAAKGDGEKMSQFFALDGSYLDENGVKLQGRQAIKERFLSNVKAEPDSALALEAEVLRLVGKDTAWVEGSTTRKKDGGKETGARFTMLLQNKDGSWLIQSASEITVKPKTDAASLADLDWLLGNWAAEQGDAKVKMSAEKVGNGHFIQLKYIMTKPGAEPKMDVQVVGWDPTKDQIVSWHFDSNGGFGYGNWKKNANKWVIDADGIEPSGWDSTATNVITVEDKNAFSWQSLKRNAGGVVFPDSEPLLVKRISQ